ncbi:MAG: metallopeptidase family protein [Candidatus Dormibacteraeota bacterium]|nr:metallopeptidase family protein [Candidatus Dormibacteraeota bacterium]
MPFSDWFRGRVPGLDGRLRQALAEARAGDPERAVATISERFPQALDALAGMGEPADAGLLQLTAWLAFRSGRMPEAAAGAERALAVAEDAATWHLLGRIRTWLGSPKATEAFRHAARLDPEAFALPYRVSREQFAALAEEAFVAIPAEFRARMDNTLVVVDDLPELDAVREGEDPDILGIYEGATALDRGLPERIVLYRRNHEQVVSNAAELREEVHETMRHEIGHHFGMEEDELPY